MTPTDSQIEDKLPDESDRATAVEMRENEQGVLRIRHLARPDQLPDKRGRYKVLDCEDCGGEIGRERLKVALRNTLCVYCAEVRERRR